LGDVDSFATVVVALLDGLDGLWGDGWDAAAF
jgi:hypothetical protein